MGRVRSVLFEGGLSPDENPGQRTQGRQDDQESEQREEYPPTHLHTFHVFSPGWVGTHYTAETVEDIRNLARNHDTPARAEEFRDTPQSQPDSNGVGVIIGPQFEA
ncbi:MAG: hypothetical protein OSB70_15415 [Myxococcota bacterium]|nr:hypothetical protein [Myxococcota bacterium]